MNTEEILQQFSTEELKAEIKRRNAEQRKIRDSITRCRTCIHYGTVDYWGTTITARGNTRSYSRSCPFMKTNNGKYHRVLSPSQHACEKYKELKEE